MVTKDDVKDIVILKHLSEEMLEELLPHLTLHHFSEREIVFRGGQTAIMLCMLKKGKILLEKRISNKVTLSMGGMPEGFSFGWSSILGEDEVYSLDAVCAEPCEVLMIQGDILRKMFDDNPLMGYRFYQRLIRVVKKRLDHRTEQFLSVIRKHPDIELMFDEP
ncbi:MAG: cyclic nucleotide-binding domain-containing protein [Pseudomonadota bacterium]